MTRLDKMLYEARLLDAQTREYKPCCLIEMTDAGKWQVRGNNRLFDSEDQAVEFCRTQAAGRPVGIVICDIPRVAAQPTDGIGIDPLSVSEAIKDLERTGGEADTIKELTKYAGEGAV